MSKAKFLTSADMRLLANMVLTKGILAINAASAATVKTTNAIVYSIAGVLYSKAALSAQAITARHASDPEQVSYVQPVSTTVYYVLSLDSAGNVTMKQGDYDGRVPPNHLGNSVVGKSVIPDVPDTWGVTPFGVIKIVTNGSTTFTVGTTALDAAGVTATYYDIAVLPVANAP